MARFRERIIGNSRRNREATPSERTLNSLFEQTYEELVQIAARHRARWNGESHLDTIGLVGEAYVKLRRQRGTVWESTGHFLRVTSCAMRHILVNEAAYWRMKKRGGRHKYVSVDEDERVDQVPSCGPSEKDLLLRLSLERAIERLGALSPRNADIVRCRYFEECSVEETARRLGISEATVKRGWTFSKAWLYRELLREQEAAGDRTWE